MNRLRSIARRSGRFLRESRARILRRTGFLKADWQGGLPEEARFWERALMDPDRHWLRQEYQERTNPELELQHELRALIPAEPGATVRILDVGAGPLTRIGKHWPGRSIEIVATDPLANEYNALLARIGLKPLIPVTFAHGEKLIEVFPRDSFDLAYASNSLDHSYDPLIVIEQMLGVVKPLHYVYLWHFANVGVGEAYSGLHQWNFDIQGQAFVVGDGRHNTSVAAALAGKAQVTWELKQAFGQKVVVATLKKLA